MLHWPCSSSPPRHAIDRSASLSNQPTDWLTQAPAGGQEGGFKVKTSLHRNLPPSLSLSPSWAATPVCAWTLPLMSVLSLVPGLMRSFCSQFLRYASPPSFSFIAFCFLCVWATVLGLFLTGCRRQKVRVRLVLFYNDALETETLVVCKPRHIWREETSDALLSLVFSLYIINNYLTRVAVWGKQIFSNVYAPKEKKNH